MYLRHYLILMSISTLVAWGGWVYVLFAIDPLETGWFGLLLFYTMLLVALIGSLASLGVLYRIKIQKSKALVTREVKTAFRHAVMLSLVAILTLSLSAHALLFWWNFLALLIVMIVVEYVFLLMQEARRS